MTILLYYIEIPQFLFCLPVAHTSAAESNAVTQLPECSFCMFDNKILRDYNIIGQNEELAAIHSENAEQQNCNNHNDSARFSSVLDGDDDDIQHMYGYDSDGSGESYNESRHTNSYSRNVRSALRHKKVREREEQKTRKMKKKMAGANMLVGGGTALYSRVGDHTTTGTTTSSSRDMGAFSSSRGSSYQDNSSNRSRIGEIRRPYVHKNTKNTKNSKNTNSSINNNSSRQSLRSIELESVVADGEYGDEDSSRRHRREQPRSLFLTNSPFSEDNSCTTSRSTAVAAATAVGPRSKHDFIWKEWKSSKYKYYFRTCSFAVVAVQWVLFFFMLSDNASSASASGSNSSIADTTQHMIHAFFTGKSLSPAVLERYGAASHALLFVRGHLQLQEIWRVFASAWLAGSSVELITHSVLLFFLGGYVSLLIQFTALYNERWRRPLQTSGSGNNSSSSCSSSSSDVTFLNSLAYFNYLLIYLLSAMFGVVMRVLSTQPTSWVLAAATTSENSATSTSTSAPSSTSPLLLPLYTGGAYGIVGTLSAWTVWLLFRWRVVPGSTMRQRRNTQLRTIYVWLTVTIFYNMFRYGGSESTDRSSASFALFATWLHGLIVAALVLRHEISAAAAAAAGGRRSSSTGGDIGDGERRRNAQIQIRIGAIVCLFAIYVGTALYIMPT